MIMAAHIRKVLSLLVDGFALTPKVKNCTGRRSLSTRTVFPAGQSGHHESLFSFTGGRWLWNEEEQLAKRYRRFNVDALTRAGAAAAGSPSCVDIEKLGDGNLNKVFLLRMNDGKEVVAKLPNPNAGRAHLVTASEAATMDYARNILGLPVPKILSWCANAAETDIEAEHILMEKAPGRPLSQFWPSLNGKARATIVQQFAAFDCKLANAPFPSYGSLYFRQSGVPEMASPPESEVIADRYVVGPNASRSWFDAYRSEVAVAPGPWSTAERFFEALIDRETACIKRRCMSGRSQGVFNPRIPKIYAPTTEDKLRVLSHCRLVVPHLLNSGQLDCAATMWHPDLSADNIFVDPENPTSITAIIDWQGAHIAPLFLQVECPDLIKVAEDMPDGLQMPQLPDNFDTLTDTEKKEAKLALNAKLHLRVWEASLAKGARAAYHALRARPNVRVQILGLMRSLFDDGDPIVEEYLMGLQDHWAALTTTPDGTVPPCPLSYSDQDRQRQAKALEKWALGTQIKYDIAEMLGVPTDWEGEVIHAEYEEMKHHLQRMRQDFPIDEHLTEAERMEWREAWPFTHDC